MFTSRHQRQRHRPISYLLFPLYALTSAKSNHSSKKNLIILILQSGYKVKDIFYNRQNPTEF